MSVNYIKEHIKIQRDAIEIQLKSWERNRENLGLKLSLENKHLVDNLWGNRILGNIEGLEFCLKKINELLELDCVKKN